MDELYNLSKVKFLDKIGEGGFGVVYKVQDKETQAFYAAKVSITEVNEEDQREMLNLYREVNITAKFHHPTILGFIGYSPIDLNQTNRPVILTEYAPNGSLAHLLKLSSQGLALDGYDDTKKLIIIYGIASGMSYLHSKKILHRDLKTGNILVDDRLFPKIADFGLSKQYHDKTTVVTPDSTINIKGTPLYIAPEIWENQQYTPQGDVYAFAFIVYEIMHGQIPPENTTPYKIMERVLKKKYRPPFKYSVPKAYKKLIEDCWNQKPNKRPSFDDICQRLKTDKKFITELVEEQDFLDYQQFIEEAQIEYEKDKRIIDISDVIKTPKKTFLKVVIPQKTFKQPKQKLTFPELLLKNLNEDNKQLVKQAENDDEKQLSVGINLIEGKNGFSQNTELGIKYLRKSLKNGNIEATKYLSRVFLEGEIVPTDPDKVIKYLTDFLPEKDATVYALYGKACKQKDDFTNAVDYFQKAAKIGNSEAMFEFGICLKNGNGVDKDEEMATKYFEMAKKNGYKVPQQYLKSKEDNDNSRQKKKYQPKKTQGKSDNDDSENSKPKKKYQPKRTQDKSDTDDSENSKPKKKYQQKKKQDKNDDDDDDVKPKKKYQPKKIQEKNDSDDSDEIIQGSKPTTELDKTEAIWNETLQIIKDGNYKDENGKLYDIDKNIILSAKKTVTYKPDHTFDFNDFFETCKDYGRAEKAQIYSKIEVTTESTFSAAKRFKDNNIKEVCCLSFSSAYMPGDGSKQYRNQEAILSRRSSLIYSLINNKEMYTYNIEHMNPYHSNYMIYTPNVVVFRDDDDKLIQPFRVSIISSTAVNYAEILKKHPNGEKFQGVYKCMKDRCRKILQLCIKTNNKVLILGAFGCGSFKNDPETISQIFKELLVDEFYGMLLKNVVFAIIAPHGQKNDAYDVFKAKFSKKESK